MKKYFFFSCFYIFCNASRSSDAFFQPTQIGRQFGSDEKEKNFSVINTIDNPSYYYLRRTQNEKGNYAFFIYETMFS